jgi:segregation and condensation protein B
MSKPDVENTNHENANHENKGHENEHLRMVEALLFAASGPLSVEDIAESLPAAADVAAHIETIKNFYQGRGVHLEKLADKWMFTTAPDLSFLLRKEVEAQRKLSRAGVETMAIIAYHQPVTRAEIEEMRGVGLSKGTLDVLMEAGWVKIKGRRRTPGRPVTYGTSEEFLVHFGLENIDDLPGIEELKAAGLLDSVDKALSRMEVEMSRQKQADEAQIELEDAIKANEDEVDAFEDDFEAQTVEAQTVEGQEPAEKPTSTMDKIAEQIETLNHEEDQE